MILIAILSILFAMTFTTPPALGLYLWSWVCVGIFPPFVVVSVVFSRGERRAFFIGCMIAGSMHFLVNFYLGITLITELLDLSLPDFAGFLDGGWGPHFDSRIMQLLFTGLSFGGGLIGMQAYRMAENSNNDVAP